MHLTKNWLLITLFGYTASITWGEWAKVRLFSERYGYRKVYRILGLKIIVYKPNSEE